MPLLADVIIIQPLIDFFEAILIFFHDTVGLGWGWAIIALTLLVRACLLPLTFKQYHSMRNLAHLQPEMKKLQVKYKGDKERLNQEMMRFYRENKVNPFASCLPMVAQFPVFIALYYMLRTDLRFDICPETQTEAAAKGLDIPVACGATDESGFLFISDLTSKATGSTLIILIVLYVGTQLFSTLLMSTTTDKTQKYIFLALPFVFVTFVIQFPAGLLLYWITTNVWTIVQQAIIRKRLGPIRPVTADAEAGSGGLLSSLGGGRGSSASTAAVTNGPKSSGRTKEKEPASVTSEPKGRPSSRPPSPPRKKKKRSGRRR